ncbi:MAG TPA: Uma2 family endonuclease [Chloroflexota bacterium]
MAEPQVRRWTLAELETLPDHDGWILYEIIDGELFDLHAAGYDHQETCALTGSALVVWNQQAGLGSVFVGPGLTFSDDDNTIPDVVWVSHARRAALEQADKKLHGAPELVAEVLSPGAENARRDQDVKLRLYGRRGVDEYWLMDPATRMVQVFRLVNGALVLAATLGEAETLASPVLPGFAAVVARLFPAK